MHLSVYEMIKLEICLQHLAYYLLRKGTQYILVVIANYNNISIIIILSLITYTMPGTENLTIHVC